MPWKINARRWKKTNGAIFYEFMKEEYSWQRDFEYPRRQRLGLKVS
jgi:hypothetical protein